MDKSKCITGQDLIDFLQAGDVTRPIFFFNGEGGLKDDRRQEMKWDDIDDSMDDVIDFNIPEIKS